MDSLLFCIPLIAHTKDTIWPFVIGLGRNQIYDSIFVAIVLQLIPPSYNTPIWFYITSHIVLFVATLTLYFTQQKYIVHIAIILWRFLSPTSLWFCHLQLIRAYLRILIYILTTSTAIRLGIKEHNKFFWLLGTHEITWIFIPLQFIIDIYGLPIKPKIDEHV